MTVTHANMNVWAMSNPFTEIEYRPPNTPAIDWRERLGDALTFISRKTWPTTHLYQTVRVRLVPLEENGVIGFTIKIIKKVVSFIFVGPLLAVGTYFYRYSISRCTAVVNMPRNTPLVLVEQVAFNRVFDGFEKEDFKALFLFFREQGRDRLSINNYATLSANRTISFHYTLKMHPNGTLYMFRKTGNHQLEVKMVTIPGKYHKYLGLLPSFSLEDIVTDAEQTARACELPDPQRYFSFAKNTPTPPPSQNRAATSSSNGTQATVAASSSASNQINSDAIIRSLGSKTRKLIQRTETEDYIQYVLPESAVTRVWGKENTFDTHRSKLAEGIRNSAIEVTLRFPKNQHVLQAFKNSDLTIRHYVQLKIGDEIFPNGPDETKMMNEQFITICEGTSHLRDIFDYFRIFVLDTPPLAVSHCSKTGERKPKTKDLVPLSLSEGIDSYTREIYSVLEELRYRKKTDIKAGTCWLLTDTEHSQQRYLKFNTSMAVSGTGHLYFYKKDPGQETVQAIQLPDEFRDYYKGFPRIFPKRVIPCHSPVLSFSRVMPC